MKKQRKLILVLSVMVAFICVGLFLPELIGAGNQYAPVEKTGQTTSYAPGDDGGLQKGVALPSPRFNDNGDGTVTDNLTGLIWLKHAYCFGGPTTWSVALSNCNGLADGSCGLTDGSVAGDWRLPNVKEIQSLIDFGEIMPALTSGHPFTNVTTYPNYYWSSTTYAGNLGLAFYVSMHNGYTNEDGDKAGTNHAWPVRDSVSDGGDGGGGSGGCFITTADR